MSDRFFLSADLFKAYLESPEASRLWLTGLGVRDPERGYRDLRDLARYTPDLTVIARLAGQLHIQLPRCPDPGMALSNLERYVASSPGPADTLVQLAEMPRVTEILLQLLSSSQYLSELLFRDPGLLGWLRGGAERRDRQTLVDDLWNELSGQDDDRLERLTIRRFRHREMLRIAYNDIVRGLPLEVVTLDLSHLADACVECALRLARLRTEERHGIPIGPDGTPSRFVVLAFGKLGGEELNYSSDIDLVFLYDVEGESTGPRRLTNSEYFAKMGGEIVRLLSDHSELGVAYRVDMRLRPDGEGGLLARSLAATLGYYETTGRTWERQALIKCRPIAGDLDLGLDFLEAIAPFVHRRYLGASEIAEIKTMKRRIEGRTLSAGEAEVEVKTGHGGIRDVEFVVQFLQLLHGGRYPEVRHPNTLSALVRLEGVGCLTAEERGIMEDTYRFLRRLEHRLQIVFDRQTHRMPFDPEERRTLAIRMGYPPASSWEDRTGPAQRFLADYRTKTELNRKILNHLLHDAFLDDTGAPVDPVVDLVLDPDPSPETVETVLGRYPFRDRRTAFENLRALSREDTPFLSDARCRHFFAAIAPRLLQALGDASDPDMALTNLEKVSASLGAKAMLWELFNFNTPTLRLYVELCASSQLLSEILINNPGMIDDLMDSLVVDRPQSARAIRQELSELCKGAEDLAPILSSFRNKEWVRIGTRDILGREPIRDVTRELADVAEAIVIQLARNLWDRRIERYGQPRRREDGRAAHWAILGLGKFGGRELNYHSDLDLVFLLESEGETRGGRESIANDHFVSEVARRIVRALEGEGGVAPLYHVDTRLRPHGASGPLVVTLEAFREYLHHQAKPWERLALTRARVIHATGEFGREVIGAIREYLTTPIEPDPLTREVLRMRRQLQESRGASDLKRGAGGIIDIEFITQYLQILHAHRSPEVLQQNSWRALKALRISGVLAVGDYQELHEAYDFLRYVEGRLRIVHNRSVSEWPESPYEFGRLAHRLGYNGKEPGEMVEALQRDARRFASRTRQIFEAIVGNL